MQKNNSDVHATAISEYMSVLMKHAKSKDRKTSLRAKTGKDSLHAIYFKHMYMLKSWPSFVELCMRTAKVFGNQNVSFAIRYHTWAAAV